MTPEQMVMGGDSSHGSPDTGEAVGAGVDAQSPPNHLSYTRLSKYQQCPQAYYLQYVLQVPSARSGAACAGSAVHSVIELMIAQDWWQDPALVESRGGPLFLEEFEKELRESGAVFLYDEDQIRDVEGVQWGGRQRVVYHEETGKPLQEPALDENEQPILLSNGKPKMRNIKAGENYHFFRHMGPTWVKRAGTILRMKAEAGAKIVSANSELHVSCWLDEVGGTLIEGYIDLLVLATSEGEPVIVDVKTGTYMQEMQLANYGWILEHLDAPDLQVIADIGEFWYLRGTSKDKWIRSYDLKPLKPLVPLFYGEAMQGISGTFYPHKPSSFCGSCWVKDHCAWGRTIPEKE